jgi:hypothetical protein
MEQQHVMPHVIRLGNTGLYIGPKPNTFNDVQYLRTKLGITCYVNLLPLNPEEKYDTVLRSESYKTKFLKGDIYYRFIHTPMNMDDLGTVTGRTIEIKHSAEAQAYMKFVEKLYNEMKETGSKTFFIHCSTGFKEEAIVGFMLWKMKFHQKDPPPLDPLVWITEHQYHLVLDDSADTKELMKRIWKEISAKTNGISKFFVTKKIKE